MNPDFAGFTKTNLKSRVSWAVVLQGVGALKETVETRGCRGWGAWGVRGPMGPRASMELQGQWERKG